MKSLHKHFQFLRNKALTGINAELPNEQIELMAVRKDIKSLTKLLSAYLPKKKHESFDVAFLARFRAGMTSADYFNVNLYSKPTFSDSEALLRYCVGLLDGEVYNPLEFGVFSGRSINIIADAVGQNVKVYGFDSFEGLPEDWRSNFSKGRFAVSELPEVRPNVELIKGWFETTLPDFRSGHLHSQHINFLHVDCDLYSSTKTIFDEIGHLLTDDAVIVFDEYFNYPGWEQHETKAFREFIAKSHRTYEYIGCVPTHQQVAVRLTGSALFRPQQVVE